MFELYRDKTLVGSYMLQSMAELTAKTRSFDYPEHSYSVKNKHGETVALYIGGRAALFYA